MLELERVRTQSGCDRTDARAAVGAGHAGAVRTDAGHIATGHADTLVVELCGVRASDTVQCEDAVLYASRGSSCALILADEILHLGPRDICLLQQGTGHRIECDGEPPLRVVLRQPVLYRHVLPAASGCPLFLEFLVQGLSQRPSMPYLVFSHHGRGDVSADLERLQAEYREKAVGYETVLVCTLVNMMVTLLRTYWMQTQVVGLSSRGTLSSVLNYMTDHLADATLDSTAAHLNYHRNTVAALLKREIGRTFSEVMREYRLERAAALLASTDLDVDHVATLCGYEHIPSFYRVFKQQYGVTPGLYARDAHASASAAAHALEVRRLPECDLACGPACDLACDPVCNPACDPVRDLICDPICDPQEELLRQHVPNFRDLGGKLTESGARVRRGMVFRSGGLCEIASLGPNVLSERGIRSVYDLRQGGECLSDVALAASGARVHRLVPSDVIVWKPAKGLRAGLISACGAPGAHMIENYAAAALTYREVFGTVLLAISRADAPVLFCCRNGRDRAGILSAVILKMLDVPDELILEDYLRSNHELQERNDIDFLRLSSGMTDEELAILRSFFEAREEYLGAFWRRVDAEFGSFERYLAAGLGLSAADRGRIAGRLVE